jgi:hypothetical protein
VAVTALGLSMATAAFDGADRPVEPRRVAVSLSERLVSPTSPLTDRANVLDEGALAGLDAEALRSSFPVVGNRSVRVRIDGRPVVDDGNTDGGVTVRRIVMLRERQSVTVRPNLTAGDGYTTTLPRRTRRVEVTVDPPDGTTVRALRANGRVVLRNPSGIEGTYTIRVSRFETAELAFDVRGRLEEGDVTITYYPAETTKAVLEVTVGEPT